MVSMKKRRRWVEPTAAPLGFRIFNTILMLLLAAMFVIPFYLVAIASFTEEVEIAAKGFQFWPKMGFTLYNYQYLFGSSQKFIDSMKVTIAITLIGTCNSLLFTSLGAYALSRRYLPYRKQITFYVFFTMLFSGGLIPWYMVISQLGMVDTVFSLFVPGTIATWNLIVMRNSFQALPESLEESAKIDGASDFVIFFRIILPISKPIIATMVVYWAVGYWNEWYAAMLFINRNESMKTLQYLLREVLSSNASMNSRTAVRVTSINNKPIPSESLKMATVMVATVPVLCVYPFLQKYFVHGIMIGSIKE